jgi:hypothetical protein
MLPPAGLALHNESLDCFIVFVRDGSGSACRPEAIERRVAACLSYEEADRVPPVVSPRRRPTPTAPADSSSTQLPPRAARGGPSLVLHWIGKHNRLAGKEDGLEVEHCEEDGPVRPLAPAARRASPLGFSLR